MKKILFILLLFPLFYLLYLVFVEQVSDPIKFIYTYTSVVAIVLLFTTTTISIIKKYFNFMKYRKMLGLFGFFYASLHMSNFLVLDAELDISFIIEETLDKPFVYLGTTAFILLLFMAITSTKKLFKKYNKYHMVLYPALVLITIHFIMAQKSLNIPQWFYLLIIAIILVFKLNQKVLLKK